MKSTKRFKTKKTATTYRTKTDEVLKVDLTSVKITFQTHAELLKSLAMRLKERIIASRYKVR